MTLKSSWSSVPYIKKLNLILDEDSIKPGTIEFLSDPRPEKADNLCTSITLFGYTKSECSPFPIIMK